MGSMGYPRLRRVGVLGDVHTEAGFLGRAIEYLEGFSPDVLLCTGDLVDGPEGGAEVERCCELLERHAVRTVLGNHDRWMQDEEMRDLKGATERFEIGEGALSFIAALPPTRTFDTVAGRLMLCHGLGADDMATLKPYDRGSELSDNQPLQEVLRSDDLAVVVSGHSHRRMVRELEGKLFVNAGTLLRSAQPCFVLLDLAREEVRFFDFLEDGEIIEGAQGSQPDVR